MVGSARRGLSRGLGAVERCLNAARFRLDPPRALADRTIEAAGTGRYGDLWDPPAAGDAMSLILNTSDVEEFELSGRSDAARLSPYLDQTSTVLDLGCGVGRVALYVAPECKTLWAVDASPRMLELAAERLAGVQSVRFARCVDTAIPDVPSASVDLAYAFLVLQHLEREDAFQLLQEIRRVLRPTGVAVVTFPNLLSDVYLTSFLDYVREGQVTNRARARIYTPQEVERLAPCAGFTVEITSDVEILAVCRPIG